MDSFSRREFLVRTAALGALAGANPLSAADAVANKRFKLIAFTKPFRTLPADQTAELVAEVGWDGVELPVRSKSGQITPEKVEEELPRFVEALRRRGLEISIITTDITSVTREAEKVLRTASKLGIKRYRLGSTQYDRDKPIPEQLKTMAAELRELAALNKELGLQAGFQNHSGSTYVGAPIWDVWTMVRDLDPKHMGLCFDIGHATVEGGLSWPIEFRLAEPWLTAVFLKDFAWEKTDKGSNIRWCPFGQGMVSKSFVGMLKASKFSGPLCQHHEYELGDRSQMIGHFKRDLAVLKGWLAA